MSVRLYVKLPKAEIEKEGFEKMFDDFESSFTSKLIKERKKGLCRGFGFVTVPTDEIAEEFIAKYNEQTFVYEGENFKDSEGNEFKLLIEKALPRTKPETPEQKEEETQTDSPEKKAPILNSNKPKRQKKRKKVSKNQAVSVAEAIKPDPRWATDLQKLKEILDAQSVPN